MSEFKLIDEIGLVRISDALKELEKIKDSKIKRQIENIKTAMDSADDLYGESLDMLLEGLIAVKDVYNEELEMKEFQRLQSILEKKQY